MEDEGLLPVGRLDVFLGSFGLEAEVEIRVDVGFVDVVHDGW
jgi:hypothetical protein